MNGGAVELLPPQSTQHAASGHDSVVLLPVTSLNLLLPGELPLLHAFLLFFFFLSC
jgi:hypothetical protein